jgi:2-polyprenyl-6-methoxyphenol hydroxylase-like FAD-dependent oxidoreductase
MNYDVIIAGAGPVGLCLGLHLAQKGKTVLILEKNQTTHEHSRAPGIWCRTQEILADLGVIERFEQQAITMDTLRMYDVDSQNVILEVPLYEVRDKTDYPRIMVIPQSKTEKILAEALSQTEGADLKFSCELTGFTQDESSVTVQWSEAGELKSASAKYLIGCDGAHSTVRKLLGFHLEGETYGMEIALADVQLKDERSGPLISTKGVMVLALKIDADLWRMILFRANKDEMPLLERITKAASQLFPEKDYEDVWSSEFRLHNRISSDFVQSRIALAGDAAHLNSPVGGQGMNAGIQDTEVLGNILIRALDEDDPSRLEVYRRYRKEAVKRGVNRFTDILTNVLFVWNGRIFKLVLRVWNTILRIPIIRRRFIKRLAMLD